MIRMFLLFTLFFGLNSCITNSAVPLSSSKHIPTDWIELEFGVERYFAQASKVDYIKNCLKGENTLDLICLGKSIERKTIKFSYPLQEILDVSGNCNMDFKLAIDPMGEVLMVGLNKYTDNVSYELAKKSAINLLTMKFVKDIQANCMECYSYQIILTRD